MTRARKIFGVVNIVVSFSADGLTCSSCSLLGLNALLLDVKVGRAAFMKTEESARALAQSLVDAGMD